MPKAEILHPDKKVSTGAYSAGVLIDDWLYISRRDVEVPTPQSVRPAWQGVAVSSRKRVLKRIANEP